MLSASGLIDKARQSTGLHDLGDHSFREGLDVVVRTACASAGLNDLGWQILEAHCLMLLSNRLKIEHWYTLHPEIDEQEIVAPLIGLGLPRTGSTALGCMLAEDPDARSLRMWEAFLPCPPPEKATYNMDPRIAEMAKVMDYADRLYPRMKVMLPFSPTAIAECQNLMGLDFKCQEFLTKSCCPDYADWLLYEADLVPTYRYMKRALKLLQWRCPGRQWRLKSPSHMPFIEALDQVFPDARFWMTHRDIAKALPSVADIYYEMLLPSTNEAAGQYAIDVNMKWWVVGLQRVMAFRDGGGDDRFIDIQFLEFRNNPEASIEKIYAFLGQELTEETRARMEEWRRTSSSEPSGDRNYSVVINGIDPSQVRERFKFYTDRYLESQAALQTRAPLY